MVPVGMVVPLEERQRGIFGQRSAKIVRLGMSVVSPVGRCTKTALSAM